MNLSSLTMALFIAVTFVSWPIIGKYSGASAGWTLTLVLMGTFITAALLFGKQMASEPYCSVKACAILLAAGLVNGIGCYFYTRKCVSTTTNTGIFLITVSIAGIMLAPVINLYLNHETLSLRQISGIILAGVAVYLVRK